MDITPIFSCVNCDGPIHWHRKKKIYCSLFCKNQAKHIRWMRSTISRGVFDDPDVVTARKIRIAHLNAGGYDSSARNIPMTTRFLVMQKCDEKCASCGAAYVKTHEIDHISGSSNSLDNLQLLCKPCHDKKTLSSIVEISDDSPRAEQIKINSIELRMRVESKTPLKQCDDFERWSTIEKRISKERKKEYYFHILPFIEKYLQKDFNLSKLTKKMNADKIPTYSNLGKWSRRSVKEMLEIIGQI